MDTPESGYNTDGKPNLTQKQQQQIPYFYDESTPPTLIEKLFGLYLVSLLYCIYN